MLAHLKRDYMYEGEISGNMAIIPIIRRILYFQGCDSKIVFIQIGKIHAHASKSEFEMRISTVVP